VPVGSEQDVGRLDVAVQHARAVGRLDGAPDLHGDAQHLGDRDALAPVPLAERRRAELHDEVRAAVGGHAGLVDREDRGVPAELRHEVRLGLEHLPHLVVDDLAEHDLDSDLPTRHVLLIEEHVSETAGSQDMDVGESGQHGRLRRQTARHGTSSPAERTCSL
jgi:hypothetical protein